MGHDCQLVWWDVAAPRTSWSQALWSPAGAPWGTQLALSINEDEKLPYREEKNHSWDFSPDGEAL